MDRDPRTWVTALHTGRDRLAGFVSAATADQLTHQSMCTDWNVAQVLSHLGSGAEIGLASVLGETVENEAVWARWNAKSPSEMGSSYVAAEDRVLAFYDALSDDELVARRVQLPFLPEPIPAVVAAGFRLSELALHSWDVFASFDHDAALEPSATELLMDRLPTMVGFTGRFTPRELRPAQPTTIEVVTSAPERHHEMQLGDGIELRPASGGPTDGTLTIPAEALLRLAAGRLAPDGEAGATISGALTLDDLRRAFPGY